eukprot:365485-Chlamydomonas_euryale.AAC.5
MGPSFPQAHTYSSPVMPFLARWTGPAQSGSKEMEAARLLQAAWGEPARPTPHPLDHHDTQN